MKTSKDQTLPLSGGSPGKRSDTGKNIGLDKDNRSDRYIAAPTGKTPTQYNAESSVNVAQPTPFESKPRLGEGPRVAGETWLGGDPPGGKTAGGSFR